MILSVLKSFKFVDERNFLKEYLIYDYEVFVWFFDVSCFSFDELIR